LDIDPERLWYGPPAVQARLGRPSAVVAVAALVAAVVIPAAGGAESQQVRELRRESADLAARSSSAVLELYALDSKLAQVRGRITSLQRGAAAVARERAQVRAHVRIAQRTVATSERLLGERLRTLYEYGEADPLEILLGAGSIEDAVTRLDEVKYAAEQDRLIAERTRTAKRTLLALSASLRARGAQLRRLETAASAELASLERSRADRAAYVASLATRQRLRDSQISTLEAQAHAAQTKSQELNTSASSTAARTSAVAAPAAPEAEPTRQVTAGRRITVDAVAYSLPGRTYSGLPVGRGVVAVDPSVIPLGTRMTIPGYGEGIAADIGSAIKGYIIDLWFPTLAQAQAWGRRTVTITIH
jgi:3D (Asp-Asp-Asp) domain-containing protein